MKEQIDGKESFVSERNKIAAKKEILRFYTSIMRGETEGATVTNRLSAAEKLLAQLDAENTVKSAEAKLDGMLNEFRRAVADGSIVAHDGEESDVIDTAGYRIRCEEDEDEDQ